MSDWERAERGRFDSVRLYASPLFPESGKITEIIFDDPMIRGLESPEDKMEQKKPSKNEHLSKEKALLAPYPELVLPRRKGQQFEEYTIKDHSVHANSAAAGMVDKRNKVMGVPLERDAIGVVNHEMAHVMLSPELVPKTEYPTVILQAVEDARMNTALKILGLQNGFGEFLDGVMAEQIKDDTESARWPDLILRAIAYSATPLQTVADEAAMAIPRPWGAFAEKWIFKFRSFLLDAAIESGRVAPRFSELKALTDTFARELLEMGAKIEEAQHQAKEAARRAHVEARQEIDSIQEEALKEAREALEKADGTGEEGEEDDVEAETMPFEEMDGPGGSEEAQYSGPRGDKPMDDDGSKKVGGAQAGGAGGGGPERKGPERRVEEAKLAAAEERRRRRLAAERKLEAAKASFEEAGRKYRTASYLMRTERVTPELTSVRKSRSRTSFSGGDDVFMKPTSRGVSERMHKLRQDEARRSRQRIESERNLTRKEFMTEECLGNGGCEDAGLAFLEKVPLTVRHREQIAGRARQPRSVEEGTLFRSPHRMWIDGKVFARKIPHHGASVLIDASGSMSLSSESIYEMMTACGPDTIVAMYYGDDATGSIRVIGKGMRHAEEKYLKRFGSGNIVDAAALEWLCRQRGPRIWVSDGAVTGKGDRGFASVQQRCSELMAFGQIVRVNHTMGLKHHLRNLKMKGASHVG